MDDTAKQNTTGTESQVLYDSPVWNNYISQIHRLRKQNGGCQELSRAISIEL